MGPNAGDPVTVASLRGPSQTRRASRALAKGEVRKQGRASRPRSYLESSPGILVVPSTEARGCPEAGAEYPCSREEHPVHPKDRNI